MYLPWEDFGWTLIFAFTGLAIMFIGLLVFDWIVPFRLFAEVQQGNDAVGWLVAGFLISTGIILGEAFKRNMQLDLAVSYAVVGILLNYLGYYLWEWLTPRWSLNDALKKGSLAAGKVLFGLSIAIGLVIAGSFPPTG